MAEYAPIDHELLAELTACETAVWQALVRGDMAQDADALGDGFLGVYPDGYATKADHVAQLRDGATVAEFALSDTRYMALGGDHVILSYLATFLRINSTTPETMYVSSVWQRQGAGWINLFSQDTPTSDWKTV